MDEGNSRVQESIKPRPDYKDFWRSKWFAASVLLLLCGGAYWNSLGGDFQYDDYRMIRFNLTFREGDWKRSILSDPTRPLSAFSMAVNYNITRTDPFSYHVFNVIFHLIAVYLFFLLLRRNGTTFLTPLIAACFMAVHPLNTESVSYITSRPILLCAVFYLLSLFFLDSYLRDRSWRSIIGFFVTFILAALSKENAAIIPVTALLYVWIFYGKPGLSISRFLLLAVFLLSIAASLYRIFAYKVTTDAPPAFVYWATEINVWVRYLWLAIFPVSLNVDHDVGPLSLTNPWFLGAFILIVAILILFWKLRGKHPFLAFWGLWFFVNLTPSSTFPLNEFMAEHHTYISLFGFCACLSYVLLAICKPLAKPAFLVWIIVGLVIGFYFYGTIQRNRVWKDGFTLWTDAAEKSPKRIRPRLNLANAYIEQKLYEKAIGEYSIALSYNRRLKEGYSGIGIAYLRMGAHSWAKQYFGKALAVDKDFTDAKVGLGLIAYEERLCSDVLKYLEPIYEQRWASSEVVGAMMDCYAKTGRVDDGIRIVRRYLDTGAPEGRLYAALMELYFISKRPKEALEVFNRYGNLFPRASVSQLRVAVMLRDLGRLDLARSIAISVSRDPKYDGLAREILKSIEEKSQSK